MPTDVSPAPGAVTLLGLYFARTDASAAVSTLPDADLTICPNRLLPDRAISHRPPRSYARKNAVDGGEALPAGTGITVVPNAQNRLRAVRVSRTMGCVLTGVPYARRAAAPSCVVMISRTSLTSVATGARAGAGRVDGAAAGGFADAVPWGRGMAARTIPPSTTCPAT